MNVSLPKSKGEKVATAIVLVVLVSTIAAMVYPLFVQPPIRHHRWSIFSSFKQLTMANLMYAADSDERLPPKWTWMDAIFPYTKNPLLYHDFTIKDGGKQPYGIAFFSPLSTLDIETIDSHEEIPLVFQSMLRYRNAFSQLGTLPDPPRLGEKNAVGFLDTHVKAMPPEWPTAPIVLRIDPAPKPKPKTD